MRTLLWRISATLALATICASPGPPHAAAATTTATTAAPTTGSPGPSDALFIRRDDDALLTLAASEPPAWLRYQTLVLSPARATPLLLFFDDDCSASGDEGEAGVDEDEEADGDAPLEPRECSGERSALLSAALGGVARAFAHAGLQVVRVPASLLPQMLRYVRYTALVG